MVFRELAWLAVHTAIALAGAVIGVSTFSGAPSGTLLTVGLISLAVTLALRFFFVCRKVVGSVLCMSVMACAVAFGPIVASFTGSERAAWVVIPVVMLMLTAMCARRKYTDLFYRKYGW